MSDQDIVDLVRTENDPQDKSDDESEEEIPPASAIKTSFEFLAMIDQQKAFLKTKSDAHRYCWTVRDTGSCNAGVVVQ